MWLSAISPLVFSAELPAERWNSVAEAVEAIARTENVPGFGVVIFDQGRAISRRSSWSLDTPFRWGSITKSFTALAVLELATTGALDLDAPVSSVLPAGTFSNPWSTSAPLTARHLLELSGGLPDLNREEWDDNEPHSLSEALGRRSTTLLWPPGLQHSYSNVAPGLSAAVIESLTQKTYADYLRARVLKPLGMHQASLAPLPGLPGGFKADGETPLPYWHMTFPAFGALNATLPETSELIEMLLNNGRVDGQQTFSRATLAAMFSPGTTLGARHGLEAGYGAGMYSWIRRGHQFWGHGGDADGYLSRYGLLPESGRGYLLAINTDRPALLRRLRRLLEDALVKDLPAQGPLTASSAADLQQYTGSYYPSAARFNVNAWQAGDARTAIVSVVDAGLEFTRAGSNGSQRTTLLLPAGPGQFRRSEDPVITVVFARGPDGHLYLQGELGNYVNTSRCPGFIPNCHQ